MTAGLEAKAGQALGMVAVYSLLHCDFLVLLGGNPLSAHSA